MPYTFRQIAEAIGGEIIAAPLPDAEVRYLLTDSRRLTDGPGNLFFAILTSTNDGHKYLPELLRAGVNSFVVTNHNLPPEILHNANVVRVDNAIRALQRAAAFHRDQFSIPVAGITGSNGKTIVKEWLSQLLSARMPLCASPNSYNSQIGVPLSVWQLNPNHRFAIFEAGISMPGEMENLTRIIRPDAGIFTNIGSAHDENFFSHETKALEKISLFKGVKALVYCRDHETVHQVIRHTNFDHQPVFITWGSHPEAGFRITGQTLKGRSSELMVQGRNGLQKLIIPLTDKASIENAMHCYAFLEWLGWTDTEKAAALRKLHPVPMRLEMMEGLNQCTLINDSYNSDLQSLEVGLDFQTRQARRQKKTVILSDIPQSGLEPHELYPRVAKLLHAQAISRLIGIGPAISRYAGIFQMQKHFYPSARQFLSNFPFSNLQAENILLKGARDFEFENIVRELRQRSHETVLEINLQAIAHNLAYYRLQLPGHTKVMAMVKAFSYGSGSHEIASLLQQHNIDYLAVAYPDEGAALRRAGISARIAVMNPENAGLDLLFQHNLEPEVYSLHILKDLAAYIKNNKPAGLPLRIHLKFDTGMHRLGILPEELNSLLAYLKKHPEFVVVSVFSHLAGSEDSRRDDFTHRQAGLFQAMAAKTTQALGYPVIRHLLNSAGIRRFPEYGFEMVRLGIGLYGIGHDPATQQGLMPVSRLVSVISQIKEIRKGECVGYGCNWTAKQNTRIGIISVGYADGLRRGLGDKDIFLKVNGNKAPLAGAISMDMCAVDLSGIEAQEGDSVVVFEDPEDIRIFASALQTIPYEIITGISQRVRRIYFMG
jgi:alanine racemase